MEPAGAAAAAAVLTEARAAAVRVGLMPPPVHSDDQVRRWFADEVAPVREIWVAEVAERTVGVLVLDTEFLDQLSVLPAYARRGIGSSLVQLAMSLRPDGFGLWVFAANSVARALYERHGMVVVEHADGSGNEERSPDVRYAWCRRRDVGSAQ